MGIRVFRAKSGLDANQRYLAACERGAIASLVGVTVLRSKAA
jgi:hypothetical protein